jgi:hypothetical protein
MVFYMADGTTVSTAPKFTGSSYLDTASGNVGTILGVDERGHAHHPRTAARMATRNTRVT